MMVIFYKLIITKSFRAKYIIQLARMDKGGKREQLQKLLNEQMRLERQLLELDQDIQIYEDRCFGHGWSEGNLKIGWSRGDIFSEPFSIILAPKDQLFSLSSISSPVSLRQNQIENKNLLPFDGSRFYKKKKKTKQLRKTINGAFHKKRRLLKLKKIIHSCQKVK